MKLIEFQAKWPICLCRKGWYGIDRQRSNKSISDNFVQD